MNYLKKTLASFILPLSILSLSACGGGGNNAQQQQQQMGGQTNVQQQGGGEAPHTMTDVQGGWKKIAISGTTFTFEMPPPVDAQQAETGELRYISKQGKRQFTVAAESRNAEADAQSGTTSDQALETWANTLLQGQARAFKQMKLSPQIKRVGTFDAGNAKGLRYEGRVGKASVLYLFYATDIALFYVEVITQTPKAPETQRFINSIKP